MVIGVILKRACVIMLKPYVQMIPMLILKSFYVLVLQIVHKGRLQIHLRKDVRVLVLMDIMLMTILTLAFLYAQQISMINMDNGEYAHTLVKF